MIRISIAFFNTKTKLRFRSIRWSYVYFWLKCIEMNIQIHCKNIELKLNYWQKYHKLKQLVFKLLHDWEFSCIYGWIKISKLTLTMYIILSSSAGSGSTFKMQRHFIWLTESLTDIPICTSLFILNYTPYIELHFYFIHFWLFTRLYVLHTSTHQTYISKTVIRLLIPWKHTLHTFLFFIIHMLKN